MTAFSKDVLKNRPIVRVFFFIALLLAGSNLMAQSNGSESSESRSIDTQAPVIELEELATAMLASSQVFAAQIAEDNALLDATLYYRREGQQAYQSAAMLPRGSSGFYSVTITTDPTDLRNIEYYIQARDTSGNRTVNGFAFDPYIRTLTTDTLAQEGAEQSIDSNTGDLAAQSTPLYKQRWFQIALGVVAVGLLASTQDGGEDDTTLVPLTINVE
jgi:hypothetical protein